MGLRKFSNAKSLSCLQFTNRNQARPKQTRCTNPMCPAKSLVNSLFVGKTGFNMDGLGEQNLQTLIDHNRITTPPTSVSFKRILRDCPFQSQENHQYIDIDPVIKNHYFACIFKCFINSTAGTANGI